MRDLSATLLSVTSNVSALSNDVIHIRNGKQIETESNVRRYGSSFETLAINNGFRYAIPGR